MKSFPFTGSNWKACAKTRGEWMKLALDRGFHSVFFNFMYFFLSLHERVSFQILNKKENRDLSVENYFVQGLMWWFLLKFISVILSSWGHFYDLMGHEISWAPRGSPGSAGTYMTLSTSNPSPTGTCILSKMN